MDLARSELIDDVKNNRYSKIIKSKIIIDDEIFQYICQFCDLMTVVHFVEHKKVKIKDIHLFSACKRHDDLVIRYLISKGFKPIVMMKTMRINNRNSCLSVACLHGSLDIVQFLVAEQNCPLYANKKFPTPLYDSISQKHTKIINYILEQSVKRGIKYGEDEILMAIKMGDQNTIKYLIDHGMLECDLGKIKSFVYGI